MALIETRAASFLLASTTNDTTTTITVPVPTLTKPSGNGVIAMGDGGAVSSNGLLLVPYGAGSATNTFTMHAYSWTPTLGVGALPVWIPYTLATFTCTLSTVPGIALGDVNASQLFCGTIALVVGNVNVSHEIISPTGNTVGHIMLDTKGSVLTELRFGTGGSATSCNCLARRM